MIISCSTKLSLNSLWVLPLLLPLVWARSILQGRSVQRQTLPRPHRFDRFLLFCCIGIFFFVHSSDTFAFTVAPHEIEVDTAWTKDSGPYLVPWMVTIPAGITLSIEPGTVVALQGAPFEIFGNLKIGQPRLGTTSPEKVVFQSVRASGITSPEIDTPSETSDITVIVTGGRIDAFDVEVQGHVSLYGDGALIDIQNADMVSTDIVIEDNTHVHFKDVHAGHNDFTVIKQGSILDVDNSFFTGGYINVVEQSSVSFAHTTLLDMSEIRIFDQSSAVFNDVSYDGGEGFLLKGKSSAVFKKSTVDNIIADTAFSIAEQSKLSFEDSHIEPLFSDFALVLDGSTLSASSTDITHILQRGIQAIRGTTISLYDVRMDHMLSIDPDDSFFISLVGSTLNAVKTSFADVSGNGIEMYSSNTVPYSLLRMTDSHITDFGKSGIYAVQGTGTIQHSVFSEGSIGIEHIFSHLTLTNSLITDTTQYGATAYIPSYPLRAINNFWGSVSGPFHEIKNPLGDGVLVSDNVNFAPWLSKDPTLPCCSSVLFMPGLMASRLYKPNGTNDETMLWEPKLIGGGLINQLFLDGKGQSLRDDIYTRDVIDEALVGYVGPNIYKSFMHDMNDLKMREIIHDWKPVPYDWRLSIDGLLQSGTKTDLGMSYTHATASPFILKEVKRLADTSKTGKVTVVAHSNGGLLAKALLLQLRDIGLEYLIDTLILVAVPQVGTPQAIPALLHGFGQGIPEQAPFLAPPYLMRMLGQNMPGAYSLLPSSAYFDSVTDPVLVFDKAIQTSPHTITSQTPLFNFLKGFDSRAIPLPKDLSIPTILNSYLLSQAQDLHDRIDAWIPPIDMNVFQIAGWGSETVKGVEYKQSIKKGKKIIQYRPLFTEEGDQTVVVPSALNIATSTFNIVRFWLNLADVNHHKVNKQTHADIFEVPDIRNTVRDIVTHDFDTLPSHISTTSPIAEKRKKLQFFLHSGTLAMDMYDGQGNHTGISTTTGDKEENIPDTTYGLFGDVVYISIPEDTVAVLNKTAPRHSGKSSPVRIVIRNPDPSELGFQTIEQLPEQGDTYTLDVVEVEQDETATSTSFTDILVTRTTVSTIVVPESFIDLKPVQVDVDNDDDVDFEVKPGEVVPYSEPPETDIPQRVSRSGGRARLATSSNDMQAIIERTEKSYKGLLATDVKKVLAVVPADVKERESAVSVVQRKSNDQTATVFNAFPEKEVFFWFNKIVAFIKSVLVFLTHD